MEYFGFNTNPKEKFHETFNNFERYLNEYKPQKTPEELRELCSGNETLTNLLNDMFKYCVRYAQDVWEMNELLKKGINGNEDAEKLKEIDQKRTILHNAAIDSINIFSRALQKFGKDNSWVKEIASSRASYGAFAIGIAFMLANEEYKKAVAEKPNKPGYTEQLREKIGGNNAF